MDVLRFEGVALSYQVQRKRPLRDRRRLARRGRHRLRRETERGGEDVIAVNGLSMSLEPGELVMIYGPSGAGKSTLLYLAATLLVPDRGRVLFDGRDLASLKPGAAADYRKHELGFVPQNFTMLPAPAIENAALKLMGTDLSWREAEKRVAESLERLGLDHDKLRRNAFDLSMGERQRVEIARALSNSPRLLLADEPTSHLDRRNSEEVLDVMREFCHESGLAALVVTHDPKAAEHADRAHELRDGHLHMYTREPVGATAVPSE
jgi:putative ABC transport system ATP-binding protein